MLSSLRGTVTHTACEVCIVYINTYIWLCLPSAVLSGPLSEVLPYCINGACAPTCCVPGRTRLCSVPGAPPPPVTVAK